MYKLIACDIDETLYEKGMIAKENIEAIDSFVKQGGKFVLATGRPGFVLKPILEELHLLGKEDEYLLVNNGALILSCKDFSCLRKIALATSLAKQLFDFGKQFDVGIQIFSADTLYLYRLNEEEKERLSYFGVTDYVEINDFEDVKDVEIIKMMYENKDLDYLSQIMAQIPNAWKEKLSLSYSSNRYLEINDCAIDKGKALKELVTLLGLKQEEVIAIGDNSNDYSMIEYAGLGVCVANGQAEIKQIANYITQQDALHGAVAEVIHRFAFGK